MCKFEPDKGSLHKLITGNKDSIRSEITALEKVSDAFGPSDPAGYSFNEWLHDKPGTWCADMVQFMTCMKALIYIWTGGFVEGNAEQYFQLYITDPDEEECPIYEEWGQFLNQ